MRKKIKGGGGDGYSDILRQEQERIAAHNLGLQYDKNRERIKREEDSENERLEWIAEMRQADAKKMQEATPIEGAVNALSSRLGAQPHQIPTSQQSILLPEPRVKLITTGSNANVTSNIFLDLFHKDVRLLSQDEQEQLNDYLHKTFYKPYSLNRTNHKPFPENHFKLLQMKENGINKSKKIFGHTIPNPLPSFLHEKRIINNKLIQDYYKNNNAVLQKIDILKSDSNITAIHPTAQQIYKKEIYNRFFQAFNGLDQSLNYSLLIIFFIKDNNYYIALAVQEYDKIGDDVKNKLNDLKEEQFDYPLFYHHIIDQQGSRFYTGRDIMGYDGMYFSILRKIGLPENDSDFELKAYEEYSVANKKPGSRLIPLPPLVKKPEPLKGGGKKTSKKEVLGKMRCIYKIPGDRKEYVKHKGKLITVKDYKMLNKKPKKVADKKPKRSKK